MSKQKLFCPNHSKTKIIMWFYSGFKLTRYSYIKEEARKGEDFARQRLLTRLPFGKFRGQWKTLEVYDNQTKKLIQKYIDGRSVY